LREQKATHALAASAGSCPAWVLMNDDQSGYYRTVYRAGLLDKLLADGGSRLNVRERVGLLSDVQAAANSGDVSAVDGLRLVPVFADDANRQVVNATIGIVSAIGDVLVSDELRPSYVRFVQKTYGERARRVGWQPRAGEDDDTKLLRAPLVQLVADAGEDATLSEEATRLARRWLDDRQAMPSDVLEAVLNAAARRGDRSLYERFATELKKVTEEKERALLIAALALFPDAELVKKNFEMLVSGELDAREGVALFFSPGNRSTRDVPFEYVKANYDRVTAKLPTGGGADYASFLPYTAASFCDEQHRADVEQVFKERSAKTVGGPRALAQVLESIVLCDAKRTAHQAAVAEFLKQY
jgi:alanyl aminopeptidase